MAQIGPITLDLTGIADGPVQSIQSALAAIETFGRAPEGFDDLFASGSSDLGACLREDAVDLLFAEPVLSAADGALKCALNPSQRYLELVAAICRDLHLAIDLSAHGWPVLSIVSPNTNLADAGGAAIPPAEGCA
jgi:hypothetical protein